MILKFDAESTVSVPESGFVKMKDDVNDSQLLSFIHFKKILEKVPYNFKAIHTIFIRI